MADTRAQVLLAKARSAQPEDSVDEFVDDDTKAAKAGVRVARSGYGTLPVYKLTPSGCTRIKVAVQSIHEVLLSPNYSATCFDCDQDDCCAGAGDTINDCPGRPARKFRICPVNSCRKKVYDSQPTGRYASDDFNHGDRAQDDPNAIKDDTYETSTPETRTKAAMDMHIIGFHPTEAMTMGLSKPRELPMLAVVS